MDLEIEIDDQLLTEARAFAAREGRTLSSLVERGLRKFLDQQGREATSVDLITSGGGGAKPGVDLSPEGIKRLLDEEDIAHFMALQRQERRAALAEEHPMDSGESDSYGDEPS